MNVRIGRAAGRRGTFLDAEGEVRVGTQASSVIGVGTAESGEGGSDLACACSDTCWDILGKSTKGSTSEQNAGQGVKPAHPDRFVDIVVKGGLIRGPVRLPVQGVDEDECWEERITK